MSFIQKLWEKIPLEWRKEITSFSHTFFATLAFTILMQLQSGDVPTTKDALIALGMAALRSAWKAAINAIILKK